METFLAIQLIQVRHRQSLALRSLILPSVMMITQQISKKNLVKPEKQKQSWRCIKVQTIVPRRNRQVWARLLSAKQLVLVNLLILVLLTIPPRFHVKLKSWVSSWAVAVLSLSLSISLIYTQTMKNCMNSILATWVEKCSFKSEGSLPDRISTYSVGNISLILR